MNHILYQIVDDLAIITLNRPEVANGFHIPMCEEILEALTLAEQDQAVQPVLPRYYDSRDESHQRLAPIQLRQRLE